MASEPRYLIIHADDDLEELRELRVHLAPLARLGGIDLVAARDLEGASDEALQELVGEARAVLLILSAPILALEPVLDDRLRGLVGDGRVEVVLFRSCAHRLVPWLAAARTVPRDGRLLGELDVGERDAELAELAYRLAARPVADADAGLDDEVRSLPRGEIDPAAGPGRPPRDPGGADRPASEFDCIVAEVLPSGGPVDDETMAALVELALLMLEAKAEAGAMDEARRFGLQAARQLVDLVRSRGREAGAFTRRARRAIERALAEIASGEEPIALLRAALGDSLAGTGR